MKTATSGATSSATPATTSTATRQPRTTTSDASSGRNSSCPVAPLAVSRPITRPRRWTNQRLATIAPSAKAVEPVPNPTIRPQSRSSCQEACIAVVRLMAVATISSAATMTRRIPKRSIRAAANGPHRPYRNRLIETANEIVTRFQPNSCSSGTISTPGVERMPADASNVRNVTAATIQP